MNIQEFRTKYPEYDHVEDQQLADALHKKHYSHVERGEFDAAFIGGQTQTQQPAPEGGTILHPLAQGATMGFADEIAAGGAALYGKLSGDHPDKSFGEIYTGVRDQIRGDTEAFAQRNPKTALGSELAGGVVTGGALAGQVMKALPKASGTLGKTTAGAATGAAEGGLYGAGAALEGERLEGAASGAKFGAAGGAAVGFGAAKIGQTLADRAMKVRQINAGSSDKSLAKFKLSDAGRLKSDSAARKAISSGFDEGFVQQVKTAAPADKQKILKMLRIAKISLKSNRFASRNRVNQVIGDSLSKRTNMLNGKMRSAANRLDSTAKSLKGKQVDYSGPMEQFIDDLHSLDIKFSNQGGVSVDLRGSMIEQATDAQKPLEMILNRLVSTDVPDAYGVHRAKRFIDNMVTYGKAQEKGLKGEVLRAVKKLRHNLDSALDEAYPEYNKVNTQYSDHRNALDALQDAWGGKVDMFGGSSNKQLGIQSRKLLSNYASGVNQLDAIENAERTIRKYGGKLDDNIMELVSVESALRSFMPQKMFNTFQGDIQKGVGGVQAAARLAAGDNTAGFDVARGLLGRFKDNSPEKALESLEALLK